MGNVIPTIRYADAGAAVEFLTKAFGFEPRSVYETDGRLTYAELALGEGLVMIGTSSDDAYGRLFGAPEEGALPTSGTYVVVEDPLAHAERARAGGAEIVMEPAEQDYGGITYVAKDPFGFVWSFGSYDPRER